MQEMLGNALLYGLAARRGIQSSDGFRLNHPGGAIGQGWLSGEYSVVEFFLSRVITYYWYPYRLMPACVPSASAVPIITNYNY